MVRSALHRVKYRGERRRGEVLAADVAAVAPELLAHWQGAFSCVVPVPLHRTRLQERGFNQSALIARAIARTLALPMREELVRVKSTLSQVGLTQADRIRNVSNAFRWIGSPLQGTVLLVDDVVTTGATISAAAEALESAGAQSVVVLALARARFD
ncbi:phosphoribosyltransferase family protein [Thermomicrobium sp. 4228-Ro]|uniref:ComF family protein n=1 Tax=Thermomicrobium sp. 4228-Ro TaxID=2993937 RepID=UPI002248E626|nr:phosphoribosyltransferase family protein [Thermomicrobium sp. 4228-Ro]MCX2727712.1 phosphoribosyltransferase family protein [Thermomicrobium sp. 4228-Ro]